MSWYKRLAKLLVPLIIGTALFLLILIIFGVFDFNVIVSDLKAGLMPLPFSWFCYVIFLLYLGFYIIFAFRLSIRFKLCLLALYVLAISSFLRMVLGFGSHWYISNLAFNVGAITGTLQENEVVERINRRTWAIGISVLIASIISVLWFEYAPEYGLPQLIVVFATILPVPVFLLTYLSFKPVKLLAFWGKISYEVYLVHGIVIWALLKFELSIYIYVVLVYTFTIILGFLGNRFNQVVFKAIKI